jgi:heme oxygenase
MDMAMRRSHLNVTNLCLGDALHLIGVRLAVTEFPGRAKAAPRPAWMERARPLTHDASPQGAALPPDGQPERGIRWYLREATAPRHAAVDALGSAHSLDTPSQYRRFLRAHARALAPVEQALEAGGIADLLPDWPQRSRRAALAADLDTLEATAPPPAPVALPAGDAALLGAAYVLEGSRFGNGILARQVADGLPRAYLGHRAGWPAFLAVLEARLADRALWPQAAAGALAAFDTFQAALTAEPTPPQGPGNAAANV